MRALTLSLPLWLAACAEPEACLVDDAGTLGELTPWEQDFVDTPREVVLPEVVWVDGEDGLPLGVRVYEPPQPPEQVVVLVHGSSAHGDLYEPLATGLQGRGVAVVVPDTRGHGRSTCAAPAPGATVGACGEDAPRSPADDGRTWPGRAGDALDANQPVRDLGRHVELARALYPDATVHLVGHSSGGGLVSRFVEITGAPGVASVVLLAPYNHPDQPQVREEVRLDCPDLAGTHYARLDLGALGDALRGNDHRYVLTLHKEPELTTPLDTLRYTWTMVQGLATTDPDAFWSHWPVPVRLMAAEADHLLDPAVSEAQVLRTPHGSYEQVPDTSHIGLVWSDDVAERIVAFVQER